MERRFAEIDALKAVAIVTVVGIHSLRSPFDPTVSDAELWLGRLTRFAVPAFLMASGFLYAGQREALGGVTVRRLRRILVPYGILSAVAIGLQHLGIVPAGTGSVAKDLLLGSAMGPYYYVFIIVGLVLATPLFARLPDAVFAGLAVLLFAFQWWVDAAMGILLSFFWALRNPLMWWAYFAVGWLLRTHHAALVAWIAPRRRSLAAALALVVAVLAAASGADGPRLLVRTATWLDVYAICALVFVLSAGTERVPPAMRHLSDASYAIYLLHVFFVHAATAAIPPPPHRIALLPIVVPWAVGLIGSLVTVAGLRAALGRRSRDWFGA